MRHFLKMVDLLDSKGNVVNTKAEPVRIGGMSMEMFPDPRVRREVLCHGRPQMIDAMLGALLQKQDAIVRELASMQALLVVLGKVAILDQLTPEEHEALRLLAGKPPTANNPG